MHLSIENEAERQVEYEARPASLLFGVNGISYHFEAGFADEFLLAGPLYRDVGVQSGVWL